MTRIIVTGGFVVAFLAGLIVGLTRVAPPGTQAENRDRPRERGSWLAEQLALTAEQQEEMKAIWEEASRSGHRQQREQRRRMKEELEAAIVDLIGEENRPQYERLQKEHEDRIAAMEAEWRQSFQQAIERTKAMLTPEQRVKYDAILARQQWDGGGRERGRGATRPSTRPGGDAE